MQKLIEEFNERTVPLLCKHWPDEFTSYAGVVGSNLYFVDDEKVPFRVTSLDDLASIQFVVGGVTWARFRPTDGDPRRWQGGYVFGGRKARYEYAPTELMARLAVTIALVGALAQEMESERNV